MPNLQRGFWCIGACKRLVVGLGVVAVALAGCSELRDPTEPLVVFAEVQPILEQGCLECHTGSEPAAGYRVDDYLETIRCVPSGAPATLPSDLTAPIVAVLEEDSHDDLLDEAEATVLRDWVVGGAVSQPPGSHPVEWADPRSDVWHGSYLRTSAWQPIIDFTRSDACGRCHGGSPAPNPDVVFFAPGAPACTDCHDTPDGVMACGTCHGDGERPFPPRDQCYFPGPPFGGAHLSHTEPSANSPQPFDCAVCHFDQDYDVLEGRHGNAEIDVVFPLVWGGEDASYEPQTKTCDTACHARGGTTPVVVWDEERNVTCNSCHRSPPTGHPALACTNCHPGVNAEGTSLTIDAPHINGRVDLFGL